MLESISSSGVRKPLIFLHGLCLDGRKRLKVCSMLGIVPPEKHYLTPEEAAPALWLEHRERCARLFPCDSISEAAKLYKTDLASVSHLFAKRGPIERGPEYWRTFDLQREASNTSMRWPEALWKQANVAAKKRGWRRSHFVRLAVAFAIENTDQIAEYDRLFGKRLRLKTGPKGPSGQKLQRRPPRPRAKKWPGQS